MDDVHAGQNIGPYRIISQIGQGGMATVYKAYHAAMDRYVALKILPRQLARTPEFIGRFKQEARTIARLEHAHILPVHDYGEAEGYTYLAMRFVEAGTLKDRLAASPLAAADIDRYFMQLADALDYAHTHGIIHRDLKPANVLLDSRGNLFLTDFGIAKLLEGNAQFTGTGALIGTPAYMSPEQAQGLRVDPRTDIYSLGIILYELVTGRVPFEADTPLAVILKHLHEPLPLPSSIKPGLAPAIERVLLKALAKNPDDRFANTAEFIAAWQAATRVGPGLESIVTVSPTREGPASHPVVQTLPGGAVATPPPATAGPPASGGPPPTAAGHPAPIGPQARPQTSPPAAREPAPRASVAPPPQPPPAVVGPPPAVVGPPPAVGAPAAPPRAPAARRSGSRLLAGVGLVAIVLLAGSLVCSAVVLRALGNQRRTAAATPAAAATNVASATSSAASGATALPGGAQAGQAGEWRSWTAANSAQHLILSADGQLVTGGRGGLTGWDAATGAPIDQFTTADGLPSAYVTALLADPSDPQTLWVATSLGVAAINQAQVVTYDHSTGLDSDFVSALGTVQGELVAGTSYSGQDGGGLNRLVEGAWQPIPDFPSINSESDPDKLSNSVLAILEDSAGGVWVGTSNGLGRFDGQAWTRYTTADGLPDNLITRLLEVDGQLWVGTNSGAARFDGTSFELVSETAGQAIYGLLLASNGDLWISGGGGVARRPAGQNQWTTIDYTILPSFDLYGGVEAPDGAVFFGTENGVLRFVGDTFNLSTMPNVPSQPAYGAITTSLDGSQLWFVEEYGVRTDLFNPISEVWQPGPALPCEACVPLTSDGAGRLWAGGDLGAYIIAGDVVTHLTTAEGLPADPVRSVAFAPDGQAWLATSSGVAVYDGSAVTAVYNAENAGLSGDEVRQVMAAHDGSMWVVGDTNLSRFGQDGQWVHYGEGNPFEYSVRVNDVAEDNGGAIWVATAGLGVYRYFQDTWTTYLPGIDGVQLPSTEVQVVTVAPDNSLWFGTYNAGAARFDGTNWQVFGRDSGLIQPNVNDIFIDFSGAVWFATSGGVSRYRP